MDQKALFGFSYILVYFIEGITMGLMLSYYAFIMGRSEYVLLATVFLLLWTIKPVYSIIVDRVNKTSTIFGIVFSFFFLLLPEKEIPPWLAALGGFGMGLLDVSADGWLTKLSEERAVNPDFWTGMGFASRSTGFLMIVALTMMTADPSIVIPPLRIFGLVLGILASLGFIRFRYAERGSLREVGRHFKSNIVLYLAVYISTSWGSAVLDVATKLYEARTILIEIIVFTLIFTYIDRLIGRRGYIYIFIPISSVAMFVVGIYGYIQNVGFLLELALAFTASFPWAVYGIINEKASEVRSFPVFYTSLLYGLSNLFDVIYLNTILFVVPPFSIPLFYLIFEIPLLLVLREKK